MQQKNLIQFIITFLMGCSSVYFGLIFVTHSDSASPVWPATGIYIILTAIWGYRQLPTVFLSYFVGKALFQGDILNALLAATGGATQAFLGAYLLKRWDLILSVKDQKKLGLFSVEHMFIGASCGLASAFVGTSSLFFHKIISASQFPQTLLTWMFGDCLGYLYLVPLFLTLHQLKNSQLVSELKSISLYSVGLLILSISIVFYLPDGGLGLFLIFLSLLYFSLSNSIATHFFGILFLYLISVSFTFYGKGPFYTGTSIENLITLQTILFASVLLGFALYEFKKHKMLNSIRWVLSISLIATGIVFASFSHSEKNKDTARFNELISGFEMSVNRRMETYIDVLAGGRSFILANEKFGIGSWKKYVENLDIINRYPGINGIGGIIKIAKPQLNEYLKFVENNLSPEFQLKVVPDVVIKPESDFHYIISLIEPITANKNATGLDVASEINRKASADLALRTRQATITKKIILVQDEKKRAGFLLFVPLNLPKNFVMPKDDRKYFFYDWIYAPFVTESFLDSAVTQYDSELRVKIFDDEGANSSEPIFDNHKIFQDYKPLTNEHTMLIGQQKWRMHYMTTPGFTTQRMKVATWVLVLCVIVVILLSSLIGSTQLAAENSEKKAQELSTKLIHSSQMSVLGEMAGGIAHEINNPLTIIKAKSEQLKKNIIAGREIDNNNLLTYLNLMINTTDRIAKIVARLMNFSQNHKSEVFVSANIANILSNSLDLLREKLSNAKIEIRETSVPNLTVECKPMQMSQVIYNLLNNAHDAIEKLPEKWIEIEYLVSSKNIEIIITDSGKGIPKEVAEKMMLPFFTTKAVGKGSGLGLSECKGIINDHHGEFYLAERKENTCFVVKIPLKQTRDSKQLNVA